MSGNATITIVTSTSSMKVPAQTATSGNHLRVFIFLSFTMPACDTRRDQGVYLDLSLFLDQSLGVVKRRPLMPPNSWAIENARSS